MSNEPENDIQADAQQPPAEESISAEKKKPSRRRLVCLLLVLVAAVVIYIMETRAKGPYEESVKVLQEKMPEKVTLQTEQQHVGLYRQDLDKLLVGDPDRYYDAARFTEVITWPGPLRLYRVQLSCVKEGYVIKLETKTPWRWEE